jgi:hypothetical protein
MLDLLLTIYTYGPEIVTVLVAVHGVAVAITNLTPTPDDDAAVRKAYRVIEIIAGIISRKAKM